MIQGIVLDAHGVMFEPREGAKDWLYGFVQRAGGEQDPAVIRQHYIAASLGQMSADEYWRKVGLEPSVEPAYLQSIEAMPGLYDFLDLVERQGLPVWCLSNDVGRWSDTLRATHDVNRRLQGWTISDAVQLRKPDPLIYRAFLDQFGLKPAGLVFVDDRLDNVEAARAIGFQAIQFKQPDGFIGIAERLFQSSAVPK